MSEPINVQDFNVYQNIVMVEDRDGNGEVGAGDRAIAKQDVTLKEITFKRGDEIPFNCFKFLMHGYNAKAASQWRQAGDSRIPYEVAGRHGVRLEKMEGVRSTNDFYQVIDLKDGKRLGTVNAPAGDTIALDTQVTARKSESKGDKPAPGMSLVGISPEAEKTLIKAGFKIDHQKDGIAFKHPKTSFKYVNDGSESQVIFRRAGTDKNPEVVMVALMKGGAVETTRVWPTEAKR